MRWSRTWISTKISEMIFFSFFFWKFLLRCAINYISGCFWCYRVRISVEGYDLSLRAVDLDISLVNHFSSCGNVEFVKVPRDPVTNAINGTSTTVVLGGKGAAEKALALNGSDVGGWRASVKILPPALSSLRSGLTTREAARQYVAHFKRYK